MGVFYLQSVLGANLLATDNPKFALWLKEQTLHVIATQGSLVVEFGEIDVIIEKPQHSTSPLSQPTTGEFHAQIRLHSKQNPFNCLFGDGPNYELMSEFKKELEIVFGPPMLKHFSVLEDRTTLIPKIHAQDQKIRTLLEAERLLARTDSAVPSQRNSTL